jgi:hypothetical protein
LLKLPHRNHTYLDANGNLKDRDKFTIEEKPLEPPHPSLALHIGRGSDTFANRIYYKGMHAKLRLPLAGVSQKCIGDDLKMEHKEGISVKSSAPSDALFPGLCSNRIPSSSVEMKLPHSVNSDALNSPTSQHASQVRLDAGTSFINLAVERIVRGQELTSHSPQSSTYDYKLTIKIILSDHLKAILVDDWDNITRLQQLVPLPATYPVNRILDEYAQEQMIRRVPGSAEMDILEEIVSGLKEYFDKCLGRILLYR